MLTPIYISLGFWQDESIPLGFRILELHDLGHQNGSSCPAQ